jgi:hypothetical protein
MAKTRQPLPGTQVSADKLFKTAFELFFGDLLEIVRPKLAAELDLESVRFLPPEQLPDFKKAGHLLPDLVAEVPMRAEAGEETRYVIVHIDTEGRFTSAMDKRMAQYGLHLHLATEKTVVSICVFLKGGDADVTVREVKATVNATSGEEVWEANRFRYLAFGVGRSLAEDYVGRPQALAGGLAAVMRSKVWDKVQQRVECLKAIQRRLKSVADIRRAYTLGKIVDKYLELSGKDQERFAAVMGENKEVETMAADLWQEDLDAYKVYGALEEARKAILLMAKKLKLEVSEDFEDKLEAINDLERFHRILEQIPDVHSTGELDFA